MPQKVILVIEDDHDVAQLLQLYLESEGYSIVIASRGEDGLEKAQQLLPDMILLDVRLPDISGWEVFRQLKGITDSPVIFITGNPDIDEIARVLGLNSNDYISKNLLTSTDLKEKIYTRLDGKNGHKSKPADTLMKRRDSLQTPYLPTKSLNLNVMTSPVFGMPPRDSQFSCDIFVVMPFNEALDPIYKNNIRRVAEGLNLTIKRGDNFFSHQMIMSEIWGALFAAKLIIADCTGRNPNVFYEMGIAHTLGKKVITITQAEQDIPFDLRNFRYILYKTTTSELVKFELTLHRAIITMIFGE